MDFLEKDLEDIQKVKEGFLDELKEEGNLKRLLYYKGTQLESAVIEALKILGFQANNYRDSESEFDGHLVVLGWLETQLRLYCQPAAPCSIGGRGASNGLPT